MKSIVMVCCVFVFCSDFIACIPYPEDLAKYLGAYAATNAAATAPQQIPYSNVPRSPNTNNIVPNGTIQEILNQESIAQQRNDYANSVLANQPPLIPRRNIQKPLSLLQIQQQQLRPIENRDYETAAQQNQPNTVGEPYLSSVATVQSPQIIRRAYLLTNQSLPQIQPQHQRAEIKDAPSVTHNVPVKIDNRPGINQEQVTPNIRYYIQSINPQIKQKIINKGHNLPAVLHKHKISEAIVPTGTRKQYLVIHPNGTVEHVDKLDSIIKQNPNYVLYKEGNVQPNPTNPIQQLVNTTLPVASVQPKLINPIHKLVNTTIAVASVQPKPLNSIQKLVNTTVGVASVQPLVGPLKSNTNNATTIRPPIGLVNNESTIKPSINITWIVVTPTPLNDTVKNRPLLNVSTIQTPNKTYPKVPSPINITLEKSPNYSKPSISPTFEVATTKLINVPPVTRNVSTPRPANVTSTTLTPQTSTTKSPRNASSTITTPKPKDVTTTVRSASTQNLNTTLTITTITSTTTSRPTTTQNPSTTPMTTSTTSTTTSQLTTTQNPNTTTTTISTTSTTTLRPSSPRNPNTTLSATSTTTTARPPRSSTTPRSAGKSARPSVVWFRTTDPDFFNSLFGEDEPYDIVHFIQVSPQPVIEKDIKKTIYPNGTIVEEITETIYEDKEDPNPTVKKITKVILPREDEQ